MKAKSFLFVGSWMEPLKALPVEQRWNVMEAIVEYATSGVLCRKLELTESIAFAFLRNEIDRMRNYRTEVCESRRTTDNVRRRKECQAPKQAVESDSEHTMNANACIAMQGDAPYDIVSVSESESKSKTKSVSDKKSSSSTTCARVRGFAGNDKSYHDSHLLPRFFDYRVGPPIKKHPNSTKLKKNLKIIHQDVYFFRPRGM